MTNNCKNNRHGNIGKHGKKIRASFLPKKSNILCPFYLTIYKDVHGYYVRSKYCHPYQQFHPQRGHIRIHHKLLHGDETQMLKDTDEACSLSVTTRNILYVPNRQRKKITSQLSNRQVLQLGEKLREKEKRENFEGW